MKALSIKQPWLWAILYLDKRIENRSWKPPGWTIGQEIALHASKKYDRSGYDAIEKITGVRPPQGLPRGAIVGTAVISAVIVETDEVTDKWFLGPYGWLLSYPCEFDPIPCKGRLGLWNVPKGIVLPQWWRGYDDIERKK